MAGYGYRNYRGRTPKWKIFLAIVLVLVILSSLLFLGLQRYLVYDETGTPHFLLPQSSESVQAEHTPPPAGLTIEEDPQPEAPTISFLAPAPVLTAEDAQSLLTAMGSTCTGAVLTLKDDSGRVYFPTAANDAVEAGDETAQAIAAVLEGSQHAAARIACFADPKAANSDVEGQGLKNTGGYIFYDGNNHQWLDPGKEAARTYLCSLAAQCAQLGFDEIILTSVSYPTEGKLDKIAYGETPLDENFAVFLRQMRETLEPYHVKLTVEMTSSGILSGVEPGGLTLATAAKYADAITAPVETGAEADSLAEAVTSFLPQFRQLPDHYTGDAILIPE